MKNTGLYYVRRTESGGEGSAAQWPQGVLRQNGQDIAVADRDGGIEGLHVQGSRLCLNGRDIAVSRASNAHVDGRDASFGGIALVPGRKCINVTLADYRRLHAGEIVKGYRQYDPRAVYRIVDDVATAADVYCDEEGEDLLMNNLDGSLADHEEDPVKTFTATDAPHLSIYDYTRRIAPGGKIRLRYMVDTRRMDGLARSQFGETFTVTVKDMYGKEVFRRTTLAGVFDCEIGPLTEPGGAKAQTGECWCEVKCVDSRGVGSVSHYFDFLSQAEDARPMYEMTAADLTAYGITVGRASAEQGWRNKRGLSQLMADKSRAGYKGLKMYNPGGAAEYMIDYHKNLAYNGAMVTEAGAFDPTQAVDLGSLSYHVVRLYDEGGERKWSVQDIVEGGSVVIGGESLTVDKSPLDWILEDGGKIYRDSTDKVQVCWSADMIDGGREVYNSERYLRTWIKQVLLEATHKVGGKDVYYRDSEPAGYYYCVWSDDLPYTQADRWMGGDNIVFPDRFTLDLNGVTLHGVQCCDLRKGVIVALERNFDTHLTGGKLLGIYRNYDWRRAFLNNGLRNGRQGVVAEHIYNVMLSGCRYCSLEGMELEGSLGYDLREEFHKGIPGVNYGGNDAGSRTPVRTLGFIGLDGKVNTADCETGPCSTEPGADCVCLIHKEEYLLCPYDAVRVYPGWRFHWGIGKQHEVFISWYRYSGGSYTFLRTVKSQMHCLVMKPQGATHFRLSGYGLGTHSGGSLAVATVSVNENPQGLGWEYSQYITYSGYGCNNLYKDCYIHDTRSCAWTDPMTKGVTYEGCRWKGIALIGSLAWKITAMLADWEEGWQSRDGIVVRNCKAELYGSLAEVPAGYLADREGAVVVQINTARNLLFTGNEGFTYKDCGGVESALVTDNRLKQIRVCHNYMYEHPCVVYRRNKVRMCGKQGSDSTRPFQVNPSLNKKYSGTTYRMNRCDDPVEDSVTMEDTLMPVYENTHGMHLVLRRSKAVVIPEKDEADDQNDL